MQAITDLVWTFMISLQFTSLVMIIITLIIQTITILLFKNSDKEIKVKINTIWLVFIIFSTFYLIHM